MDNCPEDTHESLGKCYKGLNYVHLRLESRYYNGENPDILNNAINPFMD